MNEPAELTPLREQFEKWVWDHCAEELQNRESLFREDCKHAGARLDAVVAEQSDQTLALAVRAKFCPKEAFVELFVTRYGRTLLRWFKGWAGPHTRGGHGELDLAQGLALKFLENPEKWERYDPNRPFLPWLYVVAYHEWVTEARRRQLPTTDLRTDLGISNTPEEELLAREEELLARELDASLDGALSQLPPDQRQVMELTLRELPPNEIAAELGWPRPKVYRLLCKARKWLVKELNAGLPPSKRGRPPKPSTTAPEPPAPHK